MNINGILVCNNIWKELYKYIVDNCVNFNNCQKNILKIGIDYYFEERKKYIITNYYYQEKRIITKI